MKQRCGYGRTAAIAISGMLWLAAVGAAVDEAGRCPDDSKVKRIAIAIDYERGKITVSPKSQTLYLNSEETACWEVGGLDDEGLHASSGPHDLQAPGPEVLSRTE